MKDFDAADPRPMTRTSRKSALRRVAIGLVTTVVLGASAVQFAALVSYIEEQAYLSKLNDALAPPNLPPSEVAKAIIRYLEARPAIENPGYALLPIFRPLRPTARQVATWGGDCADRARLMIRLLALRGIDATKWALYAPDGTPVHAAVEIETEVGPMAVDTLYGIWFPKPPGSLGYYDIKELKANPRILHDRIQMLVARGRNPGVERLAHYPLDRYVYDDARSINWDKTVLTRLLYRGLRWVLEDEVDDLPRPSIAEQPALMIIVGMGVLEGIVAVGFLAVVLLRRRSAGGLAVLKARR